MNKKKKGSDAEREVIHLLWKHDWAALRVAGSGSSRYPSPDIIAGNALRRIAIECKITKEKIKYFPKEEIESLQMFSTKFGAEPWIAIKFPKKEWLFVSLDDLESTGKMCGINQETAEKKGLLLKEVLERRSEKSF